MAIIRKQYRTNKAGIDYRVKYALPETSKQDAFYSYLSDTLAWFWNKTEDIPCAYSNGKKEIPSHATIFRFGANTNDEDISKLLEVLYEKKYKDFIESSFGKVSAGIKIKYFHPYNRDQW